MKHLFFTFLALFSFFMFSFSASADTKINAGLIPSLWYSQVKVYDEDTISIYTAIYNHSSSTFSGTVSFYVDDMKVGEDSFSSSPKNLLEVSTSWKASKGTKEVRAEVSSVTSSTEGGANLVSTDTEAQELKVRERTGVAATIEKATDVTQSIITVVDGVAQNIANALEGLKSNNTSNEKTLNTENKESGNTNQKQEENQSQNQTEAEVGGSVLGESNNNTSNQSLISKSPEVVQNVYNKSLDTFSYILRHWMWFVLGIATALIIAKVVLRL